VTARLAVEVALDPEPAAVEVAPGPVLAVEVAPVAVTVSRLAVTGAAVPRPGFRARLPGRGPGA
jgi:hypothetical protein